MSFVDTKHSFEKIERDFTKQEIRPTTYSIVKGLFQLNSYTDDEHLRSGHASQTLQFDADGLRDLLSILKTEFPQISGEAIGHEFEIQNFEAFVSFLNGKKSNERYAKELLQWSNRFLELGLVDKSAYDCNSIEDFVKFETDLKDSDEYISYKTDRKSKNPTSGLVIDAALFNYKKFLEAKNNVFIQNEYKNTLSTNSFKLTDFTKEIPFFCYIRSLLSKPFVILSGNSGTGKTRIATRFAKYLEKKNDSGMTNHLLVPVGADWTDNTKILGYYNPLADGGAGKYEKTDVFRFIERAGANPEIPFFLILDEMNLSHVERYFSDFLSKMELLDYKENSEPVFFDIPGYGKLELPKNLFITGTVNIDETTYMFSPKVLDRANVIEFKPEMEDVLDNLLKSSNGDDDKTAEPGVAEGFMKLANEVRSGTIPEEVQTVLEGIKPILESFYKELEKCGFEFAYRTVKEIRLYAIAAFKTAEGEKPIATDIADIQILQKILPKIHGNKKQIGNLLEELEKLCDANQLKESLAKIRQMKDRLNRFQYASFI